MEEKEREGRKMRRSSGEPFSQASASDGDENFAGLFGAAPVVSTNPLAAALSSRGGSEPLLNSGTCLLVMAAGSGGCGKSEGGGGEEEEGFDTHST